MTLAHHLSLSNERYTPSDIIEAARATMGEIDLDPASSYAANQVVKAKGYFGTNEKGEFMNGFTKNWKGRIWLNPPGGICDVLGQQVIRGTKTRRPCTETGECGLEPGHAHQNTGSSAKKWWANLAQQWAYGDVEQAIFLGFTMEILRSTQDDDCVHAATEFPVCIPRKRIRFFEPQDDGTLKELTSPTHANVIVYLPPAAKSGKYIDGFRERFSQFGNCMNVDSW